MVIIVHRTKSEDANKTFYKIYNYLLNIFNHNYIFIDRDRLFIKFHEIYIRVVYGDYEYLAGFRPDYYESDSYETECFLTMCAASVNGKELNDIKEIPNIILEHMTNDPVIGGF